MTIEEQIYQELDCESRHQKLWNKNPNIDFTKEEMTFLKKHIKSKKIKVKYGFYNKVSNKGKQIAVVFDLISNMTRRVGSENNWTILFERDISDKEITEFIIQYFRNSTKRFLVFYYSDLERLIIDDQKLEVETPYGFIKECEKKGYTGKYQSRIEFV